MRASQAIHHSHIAASREAVNQEWLGSVLKISDSELPFEVETPRVKLTICAKSHRVLRTACYLIELQLHLLLLVHSGRLQHLEHVLVTRLILKLADSKLAISVRATRGNLQRVREHQRVVLSARYIEEIFVAIKWANLGRIDTLDGVIGVT